MLLMLLQIKIKDIPSQLSFPLSDIDADLNTNQCS